MTDEVDVDFGDEDTEAVYPSLDGYPEEDVERVREARRHRPMSRLDPMAVMGGVSANWLATVFRMAPKEIRKRLRYAPVVRQSPKSGPLYDLVVAASYLVEPKQQVADWLASATPGKLNEVLPVKFQPHFWNALSRRLETLAEAGEMWRREDVVEVLSDILAAVREALLSLPQDVERRLDLSPAQYEQVRDAVHAVMQLMQKRFAEAVGRADRPAFMAEVDDLIETADALRKRGAGLRLSDDEEAATDLLVEAERQRARRRRVDKLLRRVRRGKGDAHEQAPAD